MLWPGQSRFLFPDGSGNWQCLGGCNRRWKLPAGVVNVYTDYVNGADSGNDCLAAGAGNACKTVQGVLNNLVNDQFDFNGTLSGQTQLTINLAASSTDLGRIHWSPHGTVGAQGAAAITVDGGGTATLAGDSGGSTIEMYYGAALRVQNLIITSQTGKDCSDVQDGAQLDVAASTTWNCGNGNAIRADRGGGVYIEGGLSVGGVAGYVFSASNRASIVLPPAGQTITVTANLSGSSFIEADTGGVVNLNNPTFALGGHTVAGLQATVNAATVNVNGATIPGSGLALSRGGTISSINPTVGAGYTGGTTFTSGAALFGQGGGLFGTAVTTTVASLPACSSGNKGELHVVTDANAPTYGATLTGSSTTVAEALCNGTTWAAH